MDEKEANAYWESIDQKANFVIETLKGTSYQEVKHILTYVNSKINVKIENTII